MEIAIKIERKDVRKRGKRKIREVIPYLSHWGRGCAAAAETSTGNLQIGNYVRRETCFAIWLAINDRDFRPNLAINAKKNRSWHHKWRIIQHGVRPDMSPTASSAVLLVINTVNVQWEMHNIQDLESFEMGFQRRMLMIKWTVKLKYE